jgi:DNA-binding CsgD family transcriptional regulator
MPDVARPQPTTVLTALGFSPRVGHIYERMLRQSGRELPWVAAAVLLTPDELVTQVGPLIEHRIVRIEDGRVYIERPSQALARLIREQGEAAARAHKQLAALSGAVQFVAADAARPAEGDVHDVVPLDGEVSSGGQPAVLIGGLIAESKGDLAWLRPDQWRLPREDAMVEIIRELVASGRRSRAIYPLHVVNEAPDVIRTRAAAGEQIRLLPDVPTRMFVIGSTHAVLPEQLGFVDEPRMLIRQHGIVEALNMLFDMMWERATPVPELEHRESQTDLRRFLLQQLAAGALDEQIARKLGISLRTVRRRVADLMSELGADSRFQAGVEAVRRGWI